MPNQKCIAVLDTGAGGLSVVRAIRNLAPYEPICYFADYAHLPYGLKSPELIRNLAEKAATRLVSLCDCKMLVIACHTISVLLDLEQLSQKLKVPIIGMLEPSLLGLKKIFEQKHFQNFGIVSTRATLNSGIYRKFWHNTCLKNSNLSEHACGPLVSLVEENISGEEELTIILSGLLPKVIKNADAVLLGCTHFSALKHIFKKVLAPHALIIDAGELAASEVLLTLEAQGELYRGEWQPIRAFVSDNKERFISVAPHFIEESLMVTLVGEEG